jgi:alpha-galactosidase/6-phospho-beta-glucosidase family protein
MTQANSVLPLNLPNGDAVSGIPRDAIVETSSSIAHGQASPRPAAPLPELPHRLVCALVEYERRALMLPCEPSVKAIRDVLALHPMISASVLDPVARRCAAAIEDC